MDYTNKIALADIISAIDKHKETMLGAMNASDIITAIYASAHDHIKEWLIGLYGVEDTEQEKT